MRTISVVIVTFLLAVPAAFSQDAVPAETYDFELVNNAERELRYRCYQGGFAGWTSLSQNNDVTLQCYVSSVQFFTNNAPYPAVGHNCPGGTRKVTITGTTAATGLTGGGASDDPWTWVHTSECVTEGET